MRRSRGDSRGEGAEKTDSREGTAEGRHQRGDSREEEAEGM
jgi:hypothetical protein